MSDEVLCAWEEELDLEVKARCSVLCLCACVRDGAVEFNAQTRSKGEKVERSINTRML
jgi:hypothetical protein